MVPGSSGASIPRQRWVLYTPQTHLNNPTKFQTEWLEKIEISIKFKGVLELRSLARAILKDLNNLSMSDLVTGDTFINLTQFTINF